MKGRDFLVDSQERANQKGEFHGLGIVEPMVTVRLESEREVGLGQLLAAPNTLRHVFPCALNVNPAETTPVGTVDLRTFPDFRKNVIKLPPRVLVNLAYAKREPDDEALNPWIHSFGGYDQTQGIKLTCIVGLLPRSFIFKNFKNYKRPSKKITDNLTRFEISAICQLLPIVLLW